MLMLSPYRNYKEMCDLPFCTDIYTGNERIPYSNKKIRGGTESFSPTDEIRHIELPEWYTFATNSSVHEHCEFNSRKKGYFHFMNFKTAKVKPRMQHFESFIDCIFIKKNKIEQTFKLKLPFFFCPEFRKENDFSEWNKLFTREEWESCEDLVKNIQVPTTLLKLDGAYKLIIHQIKETDILSKFNQTKIDFSRLDAVIIEAEYILDFLDFNLDIKEIISKYMVSNNEIAWLEHNILQVAEPYFGMQGCKWAY